jgi:hypothetical protein
MSESLYITLDDQTIELKATDEFLTKYPRLAVDQYLWVSGDDDGSADFAVYTYEMYWEGDHDDNGDPVVYDDEEDEEKGTPPSRTHEDWGIDERFKLGVGELNMLSGGRWSEVVGSQTFIGNSTELGTGYSRYKVFTFSKVPLSGPRSTGTEEIR